MAQAFAEMLRLYIHNPQAAYLGLIFFRVLTNTVNFRWISLKRKLMTQKTDSSSMRWSGALSLYGRTI